LEADKVKVNYPYNNLDPEIQAVKRAMRTKDLRLFKRYQAILEYLKGMPFGEIADFIGCSEKTIYNYVNAYKSDGLTGLIPCESPGRPRHLKEDQEQEVYEIIVNQKPADFDFPAEMNWTSFLIRDLIKQEYDVTFSDRGVRALLYRLGFSYTKPTYTLAKADPEKQEAFKKEFETAKKNERWRD
jgi:putative transposase